MAPVDGRAGVGMIVHGRTLEQVTLAVAAICPTAVVKLKPVPTSPLKLTGYIGVGNCGTDYRTKNEAGMVHPWQPCYHFYQALMKQIKAMPGTYPSMTLHKHILKPFNVAGKAHTALKKQGLQCAHSPLSPVTTAEPTQAMIDASWDKWDTPSIPPQPPKLPKGEPLTFPVLVGAPMEPGQSSSVNDVRNKTRPVYAVCASMYVLEYCKVGAARIPSVVGCEVPDHLQMRALHAVQWRNRVTRYAEHFAHTFARNLFDYLTMAAFGEARYEQGSKFTFDAPGMKDSRSTAYQAALRYDPRDMLPKLEHVFNNYHFSAGIGGKKWGKIAKFAGEFFKPMYRDYPVVYADHCVDLAHNGGLAFNKGYILGNPSNEAAFMAMLDSKRTSDTFMTQTAYQHPLTPATYAFYEEGVSLGLVPRAAKGFKVVEDVNMPTLTWGTEIVTLYPGHHSAASSTPKPTEATLETYPDR